MHTKGVFSDEYWTPWQNIIKDLNANNIDYIVNGSKYYKLKDSCSDHNDGKRWELTVYAGDKGGWKIHVIASFGPSPINNPCSKYDMIYTTTWDSKIRKVGSDL
jgi:hypothetical protein